MKPITFIAENVSYRYSGAVQSAVEGLTCSLKTGEIVGLVGLSASGKSTFGRLSKGLFKQDSGCFKLSDDSNQMQKLNARDRLKVIGWSEPHPEKQFFASNVRDEIAFGPENQGLSGEEIEQRIAWAMQLVDLEAGYYLARDPRSLSGGEKRRVALASIIAYQTPFYIFDEPTAGLDYCWRSSFLELIGRLRTEGCGVVWITHTINFLQNVTDRIWGMEKGRLMFDSLTAEVDWEVLTNLLENGRSFSEINKG